MYDMRPLLRINARLDARLARKLAAVQRRTNKSLSEIVKESLERYCDALVEQKGGTYQALVRAGFVGCGEGAPDLSERYKAELTKSLGRKS